MDYGKVSSDNIGLTYIITKEQRVELLRRAIELMSVGEMMAVS